MNYNKRLIEEFDTEKQEKLLSWEGNLAGREVTENDYIYLCVYSGEEKVAEEWLRIADSPHMEVDNDGKLTIDFYDLLVEELDFDSGNYTIEYCAKRMAVWPNEVVRVNEISKNKMELRVDAIDEEALISLRQPLLEDEYYAPLDILHEKAGFVKAVSWVYDEYHPDETLILKLGDKIPRSIKVGDELELWDEISSKKSFDLIIDIDLPKNLEEYVELRDPLYTIDVNREVAKPTELQSWDNILQANTDTNARLVNNIFSGSDAAELNIDYRKFENFIHFSSANERLVNFKYKMSLIEFYESKSLAHSTGLDGLALSSVTASQLYISSSADYTLQKNNIIGQFDKFEEYLYYSSASNETVDGYEYYSTTWPKSNDTKPYSNLSISASEVQAWLTGSFDSASLYDENNSSLLRKTIPAAIRSDNSNSGFILFVDMVAQHFDVLYNYIDKLKEQRTRDEDLTVGISKDLIFDTLKSFGWKPSSGMDLTKVWEYFLGTDVSGSYQSTSSAQYPNGADYKNYVVTESLSKKDLELEPLSRIINNLPHILKTKGTTRGLKALFNCYGIPSSFFKIQEFGGPEPNRFATDYKPQYREIPQQNFAFTKTAFPNGRDYGAGGIENPFQTKADRSGISVHNIEEITDYNTIEFRFNAKTNGQPSQSLWQHGGLKGNGTVLTEEQVAHSVWIERSASSDYGYIRYSRMDQGFLSAAVSTSLGKLPLFDNDWWNMMIRTDREDDTVTLTCQKAPDHANGTITHKSSSTIAVNNFYLPENHNVGSKGFFNLLGAQYLPNGWSGSTITVPSGFGSIQEFRVWSGSSISDDTFNLHTVAPTSIVGNDYTSSFKHLVYRLPLGTYANEFGDKHFLMISEQTNSYYAMELSSSHPSQNPIAPFTVISESNWSWTEQDEIYYITTPNSIGVSAKGTKIRIEDNTINGILDPFESQESSSADTNPIDLPDLYVTVSPQDDLDIDIGLQYGAVELDEFIGDPRDKYKSEYPKLRKFREDYFKKFNGAQHIQEYVNSIKYINSSLFKQIDAMLPARGTNVVGLTIKPTVLERSKVNTEPSFSFAQVQILGLTNKTQQNLEHYTQSIDVYPTRMLSASDDYDAMYYEFEDGSGAAQWFSTLTDTINGQFDQPTNYKYNICTINNGVFNTTHGNESNLFVIEHDTVVERDPANGDPVQMEIYGVMPYAHNQRMSNRYFETRFQYSSSLSASLGLWYSSSFVPTAINQQDEFLGFYNSFVGGCKMTSEDFNIDSPDTVDGGPVVEFNEGNPNILISKEPSFKGDLDVR